MHDIYDHKPMVDEWFRMMKTFTLSEHEKSITLSSGRVTLWFNKKDGTLEYDGWSTDVSDFDIIVKED